MTPTIRSRLTLWFTLAFSTALLLVLGVLALEINNQLEDEMGSVLRTEENWVTTLVAHSFLDLLTAKGNEYDTLVAELHEELEERVGMKRQFALLCFHRYGEKVFFSGGMKNIDQLVPAEFLELRTGAYNLKIEIGRAHV